MSGSVVWCHPCGVMVGRERLEAHNSSSIHVTGAAPVAEPPPLTRRRRRVLDAIANSVEKRGFPPTLREIAGAAGLSSPSSASHHLKELERLGYLRRDAHRPRAITLTSGAGTSQPTQGSNK